MLSSPASGMNIMCDWNKEKWVFKDIYNLGYPYYHIHPYKQKAVKYTVDNVPGWVSHVIIFGSSVKRGHFYEKDLDICLVGVSDDPVSHYSSMKMDRIRYDFLVVPTIEWLFRKAQLNFGQVHYYIKHEGVLVYEKLLSS